MSFIRAILIFHLLLTIMSDTLLHGQTNYDENKVPTFTLPPLLQNQAGANIKDAANWMNGRRAELLSLFQDEVYGHFNDQDLSLEFEEGFVSHDFLNGKATLKEMVFLFSKNGLEHKATMLLIIPQEQEQPVPVFTGLNFYGNQTICSDERISITESWVANNSDFGISNNRADKKSRGVRSHRWPIEEIINQGFALATMYYGDLDPDYDDGFRNGLHRMIYDESEVIPASASAISAWAYGLSKMMDYFEQDTFIDQDRVALIGHSRLGKAALWAGASDERFSLVISNNSGCGGAALSRRQFGETVANINTRFPHWFSKNFHRYNDKEQELPVDQHMLLALCAPRPLYVASAEEDRWADPRGEYLALVHASKVYELFDATHTFEEQMPPVDLPRHSGKIGYHIRSGPHDLTLYDWTQYLKFATLRFKEIESR